MCCEVLICWCWSVTVLSESFTFKLLEPSVDTDIDQCTPNPISNSTISVNCSRRGQCWCRL